METFSAPYWPFAPWIHRSPVDFTHKGQWHGALWFSLIVRLNKRLSKQSRRWWFETSSHSLWRHSNDVHVSWQQGELSCLINVCHHTSLDLTGRITCCLTSTFRMNTDESEISKSPKKWLCFLIVSIMCIKKFHGLGTQTKFSEMRVSYPHRVNLQRMLWWPPQVILVETSKVVVIS